MMKIITNSIISIVVLFASLVNAQSFVHPGVMNTVSDLEFMKTKVNANQQPWKKAFDNLKSSNYGKLTYGYKAYDVVECGSYNQPNVGCNNMVEDGMAAYSMTLRWYIEGDKQYADKAIEIIQAWAIKYRNNLESNSRLVVSWATPWYVSAAEILRYTPGSGWMNTHTTIMNQMLDRFKDHIFWEGRPNNNWMMSSVEARLAIAVFQNDRVAFNDAVDKWKLRVPTYIYQESDGTKPINSPEVTSGQTASIWRSSASSTSYVDGMSMETCRDMNHMKLGIVSIFNGAEIAWSQGVDLFSVHKERMKDCLEFHGNWFLGASVPNNICEGNIDWKGTQSGAQEAFEIAYGHLHDRLKMDMPKTTQMINNKRPNNASRWVKKWETLCYANRPFNTENFAPIISFANPTFTSIEEGYTTLYVKVDATDLEGDDFSIKLLIDGVDVRNGSESNPPYEWGHPTTPVPNETLNLTIGTHEFKAIATDAKGAVSETTKTITITEEGVTLFSPMHDAYLEGGNQTRFNTEDLRVEASNRTSYLKFDVSEVVALNVLEASLELIVGSDAGSGTITVYKGDGNNWLETNISAANASVLGSIGGASTGDFIIGEKYIFEIPPYFFANEDELSIIVKMDEGGNDVSFSSKENLAYSAPVLKVKQGLITLIDSNDKSGVSIYPNPTNEKVQISEEIDYTLMSLRGEILISTKSNTIDLSGYSSGVYLLKTNFGYQKIYKK